MSGGWWVGGWCLLRGNLQGDLWGNLWGNLRGNVRGNLRGNLWFRSLVSVSASVFQLFWDKSAEESSTQFHTDPPESRSLMP